MATTHLRRDPFDRERSFIVSKSLTIFGDKLVPGQVFDKTLVTTRRLRQLYDSRFLAIAPDVKSPEPVFDPDKMSDEQLKLFLEDHGVVPRYNAKRTWLVDKVRRLSQDAAVVAGASSGDAGAARSSHPAPDEQRSNQG